uniref:Golgi associated, gamma adaptin ear containing, ARF binding protein 2 n=1 Tax=Strigops habroptila TaxID=2489341 RepID=A0A672VA51_STRHB
MGPAHGVHSHTRKTCGLPTGEQCARSGGGSASCSGGMEQQPKPMASVTELERWLNKATDPGIPEENWECIQRFCDQVNADTDGPSLAPRLLAHKIQSPQEMEALHALTVLETCVNNCGERFHREIAKFRFLNELIKVLSPKYYGTWSSAKVKLRVTEVIFSWTVWFPQEAKIQDAYQMLKKQGIVKEDPKFPEDRILPPPSPRPQTSIFDTDEEKSKLLARLLKSNHSEDLQAANRLIKSMIKEEQEKSAQVSRRVTTISEVSENVKHMEELLKNYKRQELSRSDQETLQTLFQRCEKLRPLLFRLASETVDDDEALGKSQHCPCISLQLRIGIHMDAAEDGTHHGVSPVNISFLHAFLSRDLSPMTLPFPDLPNSSMADTSFSSLGYEQKPAASLHPASHDASLENLFVPLISITPSGICPLTVFDRNGFKAMLHFSRDPAPGRPHVLVMVLSMLSTSAQPIKDIAFQAAVPKTMTIKLQPASGSELPAFSPLLPPAMVSQVLLLSNPHKAPIRLRYKLTFTQGVQPCSEVGEVAGFPEAELWGRS